MNLLLQYGFTKHPELPNVPLVLDITKDERQKQLIKLIIARQLFGWPFVAYLNKVRCFSYALLTLSPILLIILSVLTFEVFIDITMSNKWWLVYYCAQSPAGDSAEAPRRPSIAMNPALNQYV